jgi:hypothetical protein
MPMRALKPATACPGVSTPMNGARTYCELLSELLVHKKYPKQSVSEKTGASELIQLVIVSAPRI